LRDAAASGSITTMDTSASGESLAVFRTSQGVEVRATVLHLNRYAASFEVYSPETVIRVSELLEEFKILIGERVVYAGRAVVRDAVHAGAVTIYSAALDDISFDDEFFTSLGQPGQLRQRFVSFVNEWQKVCKVLPEFKVAVADIQTFLMELRLWMEQVELGIRSSPRLDRAQMERAVIDELSPQINPVIDDLFEKFENIAVGLGPEVSPMHRSYIQRHLHPIVLCAPFAHRSYSKPLGYAGDYEMVNMMLRDPQEGGSLFAKVFNVWLLHQGSAAAHRNRINLLKQRLTEETATAARAGRQANVLNLGCGPAWEVQEFLAQSELSNSAQFTLLDFNEETLEHAGQALRHRQQQFQRSATIKMVKRSVQQLLKDLARGDGLSRGTQFDLIYCAGLFDYLPDRTCKRLMTLFYQSLAPGGLVLATNVSPSSPNRGSLELILDWHLIYRNAAQVAALRPDGAPEEAVRVESDQTGLNVFLEARKSKPNGS
jgi:extracellular factor (EF) 3-hydroxypalmitic acid methyl ester biosynthesis protein